MRSKQGLKQPAKWTIKYGETFRRHLGITCDIVLEGVMSLHKRGVADQRALAGRESFKFGPPLSFRKEVDDRS